LESEKLKIPESRKEIRESTGDLNGVQEYENKEDFDSHFKEEHQEECNEKFFEK
jgi:hypothetical protein